MALNNFIPTIWAARLLVNLRKSLVYAQPGVVNKDYEGEIQQRGDTVKINTIGPVTVFDYAKNSDMPAPETLNDGDLVLTISQSKGFNFQIDDVDKAQQSPKVMDNAMQEASYALSDKADQYVAAMHSEVHADNKIGTDAAPISVTTATAAYEQLVDLGTKLSEANIPTGGRWAVVPPWFYALMLKDARFVSAGTPITDAVLRNGMIGNAAGFDLFVSNNVPQTSGTKYKIIAGHPMAYSFAEQVRKLEAYQPERRFAEALKGLHLYGGKLIRNKAISVLTANKT